MCRKFTGECLWDQHQWRAKEVEEGAEVGCVKARLQLKGTHEEPGWSHLDAQGLDIRNLHLSAFGWKLAPGRVCSWARD